MNGDANTNLKYSQHDTRTYPPIKSSPKARNERQALAQENGRRQNKLPETPRNVWTGIFYRRANKQIHSNTNAAMKKLKEFAIWFFSNILLGENGNKRLSNAILIAAGAFFLVQILRSIIQNNGGSF